MKKKQIAGLVALLLLLPLVGCGKANGSVELPKETAILDMLEFDGKIYSLRTFAAGGDVYAHCEETQETYLVRKAWTAAKKRFGPEWHEKSGRLYYTENRKLYSCDLQGENKNLVWEWKEGKRDDTLRIVACSEDRLLLMGLHGTRNYFLTTSTYTQEYFSVDPTSGEGTAIIPKDGYYAELGILCTQGNEVFYLQVEDGHYSNHIDNKKQYDTVLVKSLDLTSGESRELGSFTCLGVATSGVNGFGCVAGGVLYFALDGTQSGKTLWSVPISGGDAMEFELRNPRSDETYKWAYPYKLAAHGDRVYALVAVKDRQYSQKNLLCAWDGETELLGLVDDNLPGAYEFFILDGAYWLYDGQELRTADTFTGKVLKVDEGMCLLEVTDKGNSGFEIGEEVFVHDMESGPQYSIGDHLKVRFNGLLLESLPPQIKGTFSIEKTGGS